MNWKLFFLGVGFLAAAYLFYRGIKGKKVASEESNWQGSSPYVYVQGWGVIIIFTLLGVIFVIESLPAKI